jgi:hypothetical protein
MRQFYVIKLPLIREVSFISVLLSSLNYSKAHNLCKTQKTWLSVSEDRSRYCYILLRTVTSQNKIAKVKLSLVLTKHYAMEVRYSSTHS